MVSVEVLLQRWILNAGYEVNFRNDFRQINETFNAFASYNDFYDLCINVQTKEIVMYTEEYSELEILSKSIDQLLEFLAIYQFLERHFIFNLKFPTTNYKKRLDLLVENGFSEKWAKELLPEM